MNEQPTRALPPVSAIFHALADYLDLQPSRPADISRIRVRARMFGLTTDWISLLPTPGDTHQSAYAHRLRAIASPEVSR
ncbi:hypothetical protein [Streptomyces sp. NPDC047000]|uniref:hypothetical protein n=1 Tax=Streptomyces sp. NPDC047000 TaxID=3155474 RepID=UPI003403D630